MDTFQPLNIVKTDWRNFTFLMKESYIQRNNDVLGEQYALRIVMTVTYGIIMGIGLPSNIITSAIILSQKGPKSPIDHFLLNLSLVDIYSLLWSKFTS